MTDLIDQAPGAGGWEVQVSGAPAGTRRSTDPGRPWVTASWDGDR